MQNVLTEQEKSGDFCIQAVATMSVCTGLTPCVLKHLGCYLIGKTTSCLACLNIKFGVSMHSSCAILVWLTSTDDIF